MDTMSTSGDDTKAAPTVEPRPVMTEYVPFGGIARRPTRPRARDARAGRGVTSDDLTTTVLPVTSRCELPRHDEDVFQGQIPTLTPSGSLWGRWLVGVLLKSTSELGARACGRGPA